MRPNDYQIEATRTLPDLGNDKLNLAHMVLGMNTEAASELQDALDDSVNFMEEIGDILWYFSNYCYFRGLLLGLFFDNKPDFEVPVKSIEYNIANLQDLVKKYLAYGKSMNRSEEIMELKQIAAHLFFYIEGTNYSLSDIFQKNINKLRVRFPEKFDSCLANNRNLDKERASLES